MMDMKQDQSLTLHVREGHPVSTLHVPDSSMTLNDVLKVNGFTPRDGSFRFLVDEQGTMINHREAGRAPSKVRCGVPDNVEQLWIDENPVQGFASAVRSDGTEVVVLNGRVFEFQTVFVTTKKRGSKKRQVAYSFSPEAPFYEAQSLVFLRVPTKGDVGRIFNPQTGRVDWNVRLQVAPRDLEKMRGFWSVWQLRGDLRSATFRSDITPLPANFNPPADRIQDKDSTSANPTIPSSSSNQGRALRFEKIKMNAFGEGLHKVIPRGYNHWKNALVCGVPRSQQDLQGTLVAKRSSNRPAMINLDGFQYGMTQFIKVPEVGKKFDVYSPAQKGTITCRIESGPELNIEEMRGRWVIARLQRCPQRKRKLVLEALPAKYTDLVARQN